jgi:hypothetical protein
MLKMSEAFTTDESARRDRIVDAEIREAPRGRRNALSIMVLCLVGAGTAEFGFQNNIGAAIFLAVPVATVIRDFIRGRESKSGD